MEREEATIALEDFDPAIFAGFQACSEEIARLAEMAAEPMRSMMETVQSAFDHIESDRALMKNFAGGFARREPIIEAPLSRNVTNVLIYDWKNAEFSHRVFGEKISYVFVGTANKRKRFTEKLMRADGYVTTKALCNLLRLPEKQVGNMVRAINADLGRALGLRISLLEGKRGRGYRINPEYTIYPKH